eukprot:s4685_g2.t2
MVVATWHAEVVASSPRWDVGQKRVQGFVQKVYSRLQAGCSAHLALQMPWTVSPADAARRLVKSLIPLRRAFGSLVVVVVSCDRRVFGSRARSDNLPATWCGRRSRGSMKAVVAGALLGYVALSLCGCSTSGEDGGKDGDKGTTTTVTTAEPTTTTTTTTPRPAGPITCPADFQRAHCSKCYWTGGPDGETECQDCSSPYTLEDKACQLSCSSLPAPDPKPGMPDNAMKYNGISWPTVCFDDSEAHFFTIGDWGGMCEGHCGAVVPMPNRHGAPLQDPVDYSAQNRVASQMKVKAQELQQKGTPPRFVLNVGDNFYPGGINAHCDSVNTPEDSFLAFQFKKVFEEMYPVQDLGNMEWWSVLGNHDYGGVCYIKGWDQQIFYTFKDGGRWIMPAQYWHRRVQFKTFDADIWFLDTNVLDTQNPADNPDHNLCANRGNSDKFQYCEKGRFPPKQGTDASSCTATGPSNPSDCVGWFDKLWGDQRKWFTDAVKKSDASWQIVVLHHPPSYAPGRGADAMSWQAISREAGIDLIISGHKHEQKVDLLVALWWFDFMWRNLFCKTLVRFVF